MLLITKPHFRHKGSRLFWECLKGHIGSVLVTDAETDHSYHRIFIATLAQIDDRIALSLLKYKPNLSIGFTAAQALSINILYTNYSVGNGWMDNEIRLLSDKIYRYYA